MQERSLSERHQLCFRPVSPLPLSEAVVLCHADPAADGAAPGSTRHGACSHRGRCWGLAALPKAKQGVFKGDVALGMEMLCGFLGSFAASGPALTPFVATQR